MKIYFVRHGEAVDDLEDKYGGWYDADLAPAGFESAKSTAEKLKNKNIELILSSPLKRASQTAETISKEINIPVETSVYLKERNTYGLLSGVTKTEAKQKYPDLVAEYETGSELLGYESYEFFLKRVNKLVNELSKKQNGVIVCVTHGKLLAAILKDVIQREAKKIQESCLIETDLENGAMTLLGSEGVEF